jgi:hypothetical protein
MAPHSRLMLVLVAISIMTTFGAEPPPEQEDNSFTPIEELNGKDVYGNYAVAYYKTINEKRVKAFIDSLKRMYGLPTGYVGVKFVKTTRSDEKRCDFEQKSVFDLESVLWRMRDSGLFVRVGVFNTGLLRELVVETFGLGAGPTTSFVSYKISRTQLFSASGDVTVEAALEKLQVLFSEFFSAYSPQIKVKVIPSETEFDFHIDVDGYLGATLPGTNNYERYAFTALVSPIFKDPDIHLTLLIHAEYAPTPFGKKAPEEKFHSLANDYPKEFEAFINQLDNFMWKRTQARTGKLPF